jgi:ribosomal protein S16
LTIAQLPALGDLLHAGVNMDRLIQLVVECGVHFQPSARLSAADTEALSLSQILHLLEGGAVPKDRVFTLVQQRGVSFRLDRATEDRLHDAGANEKLMQAIRDASNQYAMTH